MKPCPAGVVCVPQHRLAREVLDPPARVLLESPEDRNVAGFGIDEVAHGPVVYQGADLGRRLSLGRLGEVGSSNQQHRRESQAAEACAYREE
ncbi:MAG: hypothetical protein DMG21_15120 [Acidobacteria bacterium]|nr:MAG: hypothetical protein DMG21_15120 [Acidobacteriota bacterium]